MKLIKQIIIIITILFIKSLFKLYQILSNLWNKNKKVVREFLKKLDKELRTELK